MKAAVRSGRGLLAVLAFLASGRTSDIPPEDATRQTDLHADAEHLDSTGELSLLQLQTKLRSARADAQVRSASLDGASGHGDEARDIPRVMLMCKGWLDRQHLEVPAGFLAGLSPEQRNDLCSKTLNAAGMQAEVPRLRHCDFAPLRPGERTVYFVRHAEGWHNFLPWSSGGQLWDPPLTPAGEEQARRLSSNPVLAQPLSSDPSARAQLVVVSPMRRTLQTAVLGFNASLPAAEVPWELDPDLQEASSRPCDTLRRPGAVGFLQGLGRGDLAQQYAQLPAECFSKTGRYAEDLRSLRERFGNFTARVLQGAAQRIVVVAHSQVLRIGLGSWVDGTVVGGPLFGLAEARSYALSAEGFYRPLAEASCFPKS